MSLEDIKKLREKTSLGVNDCKQALKEAEGDFNKALKVLRAKGADVLKKKGSRTASQGVIESYVHFGGNIGVLVEVNCETDFVARTDLFKKFAKDIAMHIAAIAPDYISQEQVPQDVSEQVKDKQEYCKKNCLLNQPFVKDSTMTVADYLKKIVSQTGENIKIERFVRFVVGEEDEG
ncbi:MAG: elongation factor Ts [Candidatus Omnitrophica bacterium]|nr:elongation factor Ts [Candidatus Omnitrophota bacterium]MCF7877131.1 elongation factor Ts [Candidatus Omnitrophota bacterium]MCF7878728.1 elongation factor Ts [Candidatus Omnitrophota bacterium]MCF7892795.1 elongation factor Ts [Candidatus Omnitrophota bacterium]